MESDREVTSMKQNKARMTDSLKALRREALKATDEKTWDTLMADMTNPAIGGLSPEDAKNVGKAIRQAYIREALEEEPEDDEAPEEEAEPVEDESESEDLAESDADDEMLSGDAPNVEDEVEFSADAEDGAAEDSPFAAGGGLDEGSAVDDEFDGDEEFGGGLEEGDEFGLDDGLGGEEEVLSAEEPMTLSLPGGLKLRIEVEDSEDGLLGSDQEEEFTMPKPESVIEGTVAARHAKRMAALQRQAQQQMPEDIHPVNRGHGDDTSHGGKPFKMEDATLGVANPGEKKPTMTLENSEGNVLRSDPGWNKPVVPTKNPKNLQNQGNKETFTFDNEKSGWSTRTVDGTDTPLPTEGMNATDDLGWDKGFEEFDPPTQLPQYAAETRTTILSSPRLQGIIREAGMMRECAGCNNPAGYEIEPVQCPTCMSKYALCEECITDIEKEDTPDECPICTAIAEEAGMGQRTATGPNWSAWAGTPEDEREAVKDDRGDDVNGDGGFRTTKMKGGMPKDKNAEDMDIDAGGFEKKSMRLAELERENGLLKREIGRVKMAAATAATMAEIGDIEVSEIIPQMGYFIDSELPTTALKTLRETFAQQAQRRSRRVLAHTEQRMSKQASRDRGMLMSPYPTTGSSRSMEMADLRDALQGIFTHPRFEDEED
jgi:hypothetical protein